MFSIKFEDGSEETAEIHNLDVPKLNRKKVTLFRLSLEEDQSITVDVKSGLFYLNNLEVPFAFHSDTTQFVLFRRMRVDVSPGSIEDGVINKKPYLHAYGFGLRNTLATPSGTEKNHVQLFWLNADGVLTMGGNK